MCCCSNIYIYQSQGTLCRYDELKFKRTFSNATSTFTWKSFSDKFDRILSPMLTEGSFQSAGNIRGAACSRWFLPNLALLLNVKQ